MGYLTAIQDNFDFSGKGLAYIAAGIICLHLLSLSVYRAWFHPLSKVPGPRLAAITFLVEFYHNVIKDGTYYKRVAHWHEQYGPVVRITPDEVHVSDPDAYDQIYRMGTGFHKDPDFYGHFTGDEKTMIFMMTSNHLHRASRAPLNGLFSKRSVEGLEQVFRTYADKLCGRLKRAGSKADMRHALGCYVIDTLTQYSFGVSFDLLDAEDFSKGYFDMIKVMNQCIWAFRMLPKWLIYRLTHLPVSTAPFPMRYMHDICTKQLAVIKESSSEKSDTVRRTVFHQLLDTEIKDENGVKQQYTDDMLVAEATEIVIAGAASTSDVMATTLLGVISNPSIHSTLRAELLDAFPDKNINGKQLETLPFLTACLKESLRIANPILGRLPRVVDTPFIELNGIKIPRNSIVSQSAYFLHYNADIFPSPESYAPSRWLDNPELEKYLVPFSRGHRGCLGMHLAWNQLYWAIATLIIRFENIRLAEGSVRSVKDEKKVDYFVSFVEKSVPAFRVDVE